MEKNTNAILQAYSEKIKFHYPHTNYIYVFGNDKKMPPPKISEQMFPSLVFPKLEVLQFILLPVKSFFMK